MSGGVDSSVVASLLAKASRGYKLSAIYMRNWDTRDETGTDDGCEWKKDWKDVKEVCRKLEIPCEMIDLSQQYWNRVFEPALEGWQVGYTPNPDVSCNTEIKFGALLDELNMQDSWLATGHYARLEKHIKLDRTATIKLLRGVDKTKDQSYWLSGVPEAKFKKVLFPLGHLAKTEVREIAKREGLPTASRRESMGICFVGRKRSFPSFLNDYLVSKPGNIVTADGKILGKHQGLWRYTIGQGAKIPGMPKRLFVSEKDIESNTLVVVDDPHHPSLLCKQLTVESFKWIWSEHPPDEALGDAGMLVEVKIRSVMQPVPAVLRMRNKASGSLIFRIPEHAVAVGQIAGIYQGDWCLGSGVICGQISVAQASGYSTAYSASKPF
ncbi:5-methylaminomethyl-2-thiouridylate-methyltransferase [Serendipita vermifera]|nr:5-methylaminomethyl-2-thiouridylate-methyltransferase [Serendipita vermifera]